MGSGPTAARLVAFEVLRRTFEDGAYSDRAFRAASERMGLEGRDRADAQRLSFGAVQRRGTSDHLIARLAGRKLKKIDPPLLAALRLGMFELLFSGGADHASVDQAVELAKRGRRRGSGMVNAVLRRAARERPALLAELDDATPEGAAIAHSVPVWICELWWEQLGPEGARVELTAANERPPRTYRARGQYSESSGLPRVPRIASAAGRSKLVSLGENGASGVEDGVAAGDLIPQSAGSALVVDLLEVETGHSVLDLCAAPGTKTAQIADQAGDARLTAVEVDPSRASALGERLHAFGHDGVEVVVGDARTVDLPGGYDRILVDAPCSGLGTLAARPDLRWRGDAERASRTAGLQRELLARGQELLAPGGRLIYSTCTINREEGADVVSDVAPAGSVVDLSAQLPGLSDKADRRFLQTRPSRDGTDGFFIAALGGRA